MHFWESIEASDCRYRLMDAMVFPQPSLFQLRNFRSDWRKTGQGLNRKQILISVHTTVKSRRLSRNMILKIGSLWQRENWYWSHPTILQVLDGWGVLWVAGPSCRWNDFGKGILLRFCTLQVALESQQSSLLLSKELFSDNSGRKFRPFGNGK